MISVKEAQNIILNQQLSAKSETVDIEQSVGFVLAEDIVADRAMPPFNRVAMDGIAINFLDYESGIRKWRVAQTQYAGEEASSIESPGECVEVMTGAVLPMGCDTIIRYEDLQSTTNIIEKYFELMAVTVKHHQNIHEEGSDKKKGEIILKKGQILSPSDIALLATVGKNNVSVIKKLTIAVIATGDELTKVEDIPSSYQIRASNHLMIAAALNDLGFACDKFLMRDDLSQLQELLSKCLLSYDIIVLTGAVSKGKADFIPAILESLKVNNLFHGVAQRPAKPFWFGRKEQCLVFAMPGNPVSASVCTYVYLIPYLKQIQGIKTHRFKTYVAEEISFKPTLTYFMQARVSQDDSGKLMAIPFQGNGSGDLTNLAEINAFVALPASENQFNLNEMYEVYFTRDIIY